MQTRQTQFRFKFYMISFIISLFIGMFGFKFTEGLPLIDSLYFSIVTVATVGYGDIYPHTLNGKFLTIFLITIGTGTFLGLIATATEAMLNRREKKVYVEKLNMITGVFFSEVGTKLLMYFVTFDQGLMEVRNQLLISNKWTEQNFIEVNKKFNKYKFEVNVDNINFNEFKAFLTEKREIMVGLLEHPILLEHGSFTNLLRAVFHLLEELSVRDDFDNLIKPDKDHLAIDINRSYNLLVKRWLDYMKYLKYNYPYLFSLAVRTNPFDKNASPIVRE